jgi:predicted phage replisome organizer
VQTGGSGGFLILRGLWMTETKKYWMKLNEHFFDDDEMIFLKVQKNGYEYLYLWQRLLLKCLKTDPTNYGFLRFTNTIPYSPELLAELFGMNVDVVRVGITVFQKIGLLEILEDGTYYIEEVQKLIGKDSDSTERVRRHREKKKLLGLPATNVTCNVTAVTSNDNEEEEEEEESRDRSRGKEDVSVTDASLSGSKQPPIPTLTQPNRKPKSAKNEWLPEDRKKYDRMKLFHDSLLEIVPQDYFRRCKVLPKRGERTGSHPDLFQAVYDTMKKLDRREIRDEDCIKWILENKLENGDFRDGLNWGIVICFINDAIAAIGSKGVKKDKWADDGAKTRDKLKREMEERNAKG